MSHVVLLGDSIFDNATYVPGGPPVIEQLRAALPSGWKATLLAVDGDKVEDVAAQIPLIPVDATHLVISVGGNDALGAVWLLGEPSTSVRDSLGMLSDVVVDFQKVYTAMMDDVLGRRLPTSLCTIYDHVHILGEAEKVAISGFNDVITRTASKKGLPLIDLREVCTDFKDYSALSPIEPSVHGGAKITAVIARMLAGHDFSSRRTTVWV